MDDRTLSAAIEAYKSEAAKVRDNAGHAGRWDDGGAAEMLARVDAFMHGRNGTIPEFLKPYIKQAERLRDLEYAQYLRLKDKFKGDVHG